MAQQLKATKNKYPNKPRDLFDQVAIPGKLMSINNFRNPLNKSVFLIFYTLVTITNTDWGCIMSDLCNRDGAKRLAMKIQDFWRKRGFDVSIEVKDEGFVSTMRSARTDVRSNMINGMPTKYAGADVI